ncbi:MAG: hypothetical protein MUD12_07375 [Spirochaetes bacterium]|jgi:hypothetical protein|nr:hypothetical protein [Spirochaetota bacterium]
MFRKRRKSVQDAEDRALAGGKQSDYAMPLYFARLFVTTVCGLFNFIYLAVSPMIVFSFLGGGDSRFVKKAASLISAPPAPPGPVIINASIDPVFLIPFYFLLAVLALMTVIIFIILVINIPATIAKFYIDRLGDYLFIDGKRTVKFFVMILLPLLYLSAIVVFKPAALANELLEGMIMSTISHTGIVLLIFCIASFRDWSDAGRDEKYRPLKILYGVYLRIVLVGITFVMFAGPYLAFYHIETDRLWVGVFHVFLIYSVYSNYKFYRDSLIINYI